MAIGLTLYQLAGRRTGPEVLARPDRPKGRLVWLHAPGMDQGRGLWELARHILEEDGHPVLITAPEPGPLSEGALWQPVPGEGSAELRGFLDHWRPEAILFSGGELRPAMILEAAERRIPMAMVDARAPVLPPGREGWYPGLMKSALSHLAEILVVDDGAGRAMRKAGAHRIAVTGRLEEPSAILPCTEAERAALARQLVARPVWLATGLPEAEEPAVIEAHRAALRLAHRLLLIVVPQNPDRAPVLAERLERAEGWQVALRNRDEEPEPETEVLIADAAELGLWYRLAPLTFLGGSLAGTGCQCDPMAPAALGSALIHGPRPGPFGLAFGRLGAARAARSVGSAADLAEALAELLSPDRAARLAQAAWAVCSDGAEASERALALLRRLLGEA